MVEAGFVGSALAAALGVFIASKLFSGVRVKGGGTLIAVSLVFGLLNVLLRWVLTVTIGIALFPLGVLTLFLVYLLLGIFVNMALLWLTDKLISDFEIKRFGSLFGTAVLVSLSFSVVAHFLAAPHP